MTTLTITLKRPTPRRSLGFVEGQVLDAPGEPGWERRPGAVVHVLFPGIPLAHWTLLAEAESVPALDTQRRLAGHAYRVTEWHTGGVRPSPTGHDLHLVYATLLCAGQPPPT